MPLLSEVYASIANASDPRQALLEHSFQGLTDQEIAERTKQAQFYRGKVRDLIIHDKTIDIIHSDRLTAFDRYLDLVPYKGVILNHISASWLEKAKEVTETHLIKRADSRTLLVHKSDPVKVEVVVRGYLAGSIARAYAKGERTFCGVDLPDGLAKNGKFATPIITPTTKAPVGDHDEAITHAEVVSKGLCTAAEWNQICEVALNLFALGTKVNAELGWILVDTKYEFGRNENGKIILIDEIHTPDSSRFWEMDSVGPEKDPVMLDKEIVRRWLLEQGFEGHGDAPEIPVSKLLELANVYLQVAEKIAGERITV